MYKRQALDVAASELYDSDRKVYCFPGEGRQRGEEVVRTAEEMLDYYADLISEFPVCSIEDPLDEEDWDGWKALTEKIGDQMCIRDRGCSSMTGHTTMFRPMCGGRCAEEY